MFIYFIHYRLVCRIKTQILKLFHRHCPVFLVLIVVLRLREKKQQSVYL